MDWLRKVAQALQGAPRGIPDGLWHSTIAQYPFLTVLSAAEQARLRSFSALFLSHKEFHGVGLEMTDAVALAIAAQACLPVLHLHAKPARALAWYDDFVGINVYPGEMRARRKVQDATGVVHHYSEDLRGEAMENGPVTLSWADVQRAGHTAVEGYNVVVHEFAHKLDMKSGAADGCPPLPSRNMHARWQAVMAAEYLAFCDAVQLSERFGAAPPYLDAYAATNPGEFFAVASEAYFVNRAALQNAHPALPSLFDGFYLQAKN
jgi:MtfA peptidase